MDNAVELDEFVQLERRRGEKLGLFSHCFWVFLGVYLGFIGFCLGFFLGFNFWGFVSVFFCYNNF